MKLTIVPFIMLLYNDIYFSLSFYFKVTAKCAPAGNRTRDPHRASDFRPRGPWFDSPPVHISL